MINPKYTILPFRFIRNNSELLLVNESGEYIYLAPRLFEDFINYKLTPDMDIFLDLKSKNFVTDTELEPVIDLLAIKYRSKKAFLKNFTALHMIVITARCNFRCKYCHASSEGIDKSRWDMNQDTARNVVNMIFKTPSPLIKIEFQGGEPLSNWELVKFIIDYAENLNFKHKKGLEFVLCTNLTLLTEEILNFLKSHNVLISTSLDGPEDLHDKQRVLRSGEGTYSIFREKLLLARKVLGSEKISALMTTTRFGLTRLRDIIDEYRRREFRGIFIRPLNPFGFAKLEQNELGYSAGEFVDVYKSALSYIIDINLKGEFFAEHYASIFLSRILTPFSTGFMDLQFPSGIGITGAIYDYDGSVYPSDEARMMAKSGNKRFCLGNVNSDDYLSIFDSELLRNIINKSCAEILPGCSLCAFNSYCGVDPIRNFSEQNDIVGYRPENEFCQINFSIISYLFTLLKNEDIQDVFLTWIYGKPCKEFSN